MKKKLSILIISVLIIQLFVSVGINSNSSAATYYDLDVSLDEIDPDYKWDTFGSENEYSFRIHYKASSGWQYERASDHCTIDKDNSWTDCGVSHSASLAADIDEYVCIQIIEEDSFNSYETIAPTVHDRDVFHCQYSWDFDYTGQFSNSKGETFEFTIDATS